MSDDEADTYDDLESYEGIPDGFHASASTFKEIEAILREYEIKHTVRFACCRGHKHFNIDFEPWKGAIASKHGPKLMWGSDSIPLSDKPFISVARKLYTCQYGKQRHGKKRGAGPNPSYKMGCPCQCDVAEIQRLVYPKAKHGGNGEITKHHRRDVAIKYRENIRKHNSGLPSDLVWEREFHINISPLSTHSHVTGEGAAEHQRIDPILIERIHQLAAAGITASDVIRDHLVHYVEEEMFKGRELPLRNNRRFYPNSRDIRNHVYLTKSNVDKRQKSTIVVSESDLAATSIADEGVIYHDDGETVQVGRYESVQQYQQQEYQPDQQYYTNNGYNEYTNQTQGYADVSTYSTVSTTGKKSRKSFGLDTPPGTTTRPATSKGKFRNPKEKFVGLVKKLYRIANAIDYQHDMNKLTASLINTIMLAKPMIPEHKMGVLFEEDPRVLLHPRRIRTYKKKEPAPRKRRFPDVNPDAVKLPDKKALKKEAKRKEIEARNAKKAKMLAEGERLLQEAAAKRKAEPKPNLSQIRILIAGKDGQATPKVIIKNEAAKTLASQIPVLLQQEGQKAVLQNLAIKPQNSADGKPSSLLKTSKMQTVILNPTNQSLVGAVQVAVPNTNILTTPLQSLGVITENKSPSAKYVSLNYTSILPSTIVAATNSSVTVSPLADKSTAPTTAATIVVPAATAVSVTGTGQLSAATDSSSSAVQVSIAASTSTLTSAVTTSSTNTNHSATSQPVTTTSQAV